MKLIYKSIQKKELKKLQKTYCFDMAGAEKNNRRGTPRLIKKGSVPFINAKEHKTTMPLLKALKLVIEKNFGVLTILDDPVSDIIEKFLCENGNTGLILKEP